MTRARAAEVLDVTVLSRKDERRLRRFQREARMAAKLHHTNIVPVLGVGEDEGHHFIVMQFIRGVGLDEILAALIDLVELGDADAGKPATTPGHSPSPDSKPAQARQLARRLASSPRCLSAFGISSTSASKPSDAGSTGRETTTLDANDDTELPTGPNGQATSQTPESPEASEPETSETSASICGPASRLAPASTPALRFRAAPRRLSWSSMRRKRQQACA